jgi:2-oxoglutarate dehydrogenase E2 component (dihydrolipoamide succinyltransferase)
MVDSKRISPHVTSFVEADMTNIVFWRNKMKHEFQKREGDSLTFTPVFIEAIIQAIKDFPMINIQVDGDKIIKKKDINIGMAVALPSGNLIVPVIKNADQFNITGLAKAVNDLAKRARENKLKPDELSGGTYTVTNVGSFGNVMGHAYNHATTGRNYGDWCHSEKTSSSRNSLRRCDCNSPQSIFIALVRSPRGRWFVGWQLC